MTDSEERAIDKARMLKCRWIARDKNGKLYAYTNKPKKLDELWYSTYGMTIKIKEDISFIKWEDKEPYYIENNEVYDE